MCEYGRARIHAAGIGGVALALSVRTTRPPSVTRKRQRNNETHTRPHVHDCRHSPSSPPASRLPRSPSLCRIRARRRRSPRPSANRRASRCRPASRSTSPTAPRSPMRPRLGHGRQHCAGHRDQQLRSRSPPRPSPSRSSGAGATWVSSDVTWGVATFSNAGVGSAGVLAGVATDQLVATCAVNVASCSTTNLAFSLAAKPAVVNAGNHTLVITWKFASIGA